MMGVAKNIIVTLFVIVFASSSFAEGVKASDIKKEGRPSFTLEPIATVKLDYLYVSNNKNRFYFRNVTGGIKGDIFYDFKYKLKFNLADVRDRVTQAYLEYKGFDPFSIRVGRFSPAFFLDYTSSFNEYPASGAMLESLKDGVQVRTYGDKWTLTASYGNSSAIRRTQPLNKRHAFYLSGTYLPYYDEAKQEFILLGVANSYMKPFDHTLKYKATPEAASNAYLLNTGSLLGVRHANVTNVGVAYNKGPFSAQAEYLLNHINRRSGNKDLFYHGGYAQVAYFLTGESNGYDNTKGSVNDITVKNPVFEFGKKNQKLGTGAWEVAAKYSTLNLNDNNKGRFDLYGVALNWYLNDTVKLANDFLIARTDKNAVMKNKTPKIVSIRLEFDL